MRKQRKALGMFYTFRGLLYILICMLRFGQIETQVKLLHSVSVSVTAVLLYIWSGLSVFSVSELVIP